MLREKSDAIKNLKSAVLTRAKEIGERIFNSRIEEQEDILFRVREVSRTPFLS